MYPKNVGTLPSDRDDEKSRKKNIYEAQEMDEFSHAEKKNDPEGLKYFF
jgi:hypothetical protein